MRSKIIFCLSCFFSLLASAQNNDLTGTWKGTLETIIGYNFPISSVEVVLQIKQEGNLVWAVCSIGNKTKIDSCDCSVKLIFEPNRRNNFVINFFQDGVIKDKTSFNDCLNFEGFQLIYLKEKNEEELHGKWYGPSTLAGSMRNTQPSNEGLASFKKISSSTEIDIDKYFASKD